MTSTQAKTEKMENIHPIAEISQIFLKLAHTPQISPIFLKLAKYSSN